MSEPLKGKYSPVNYKKYKGDPTNIIYRSSWELKFMRYLDLNENIIQWSSEEFCIPYKDPTTGKYRRYFPDFYIKYVDKNKKIVESVIEIKPKKQVIGPPVNPKRRTKGWIKEVYEYAKNQSKWDAAKEYCKDRLWEFKILTENELGI